LWNYECNRPEIVKDEKFVFRMGNDGGGMVNVGNFLIACQTLRTRFEFQGLPLRPLSRQVWEHCGVKLRSLFICNCDVDDKTVKNVILYCIELTQFHVQSSKESYELELNPDGASYRGVFCSEGILDELIERKFQQRKLVSLELFFAVRVPTRMYQKLFQIYPCVRTFGHGFRSSLHSIDFKNFHVTHYNSAEEWPVLPPLIENFTSNIVNNALSWKRTKVK
jgi:hypothetical protein